MTAGSENLTELAQRMLDEIGNQRPVAIWEKVGTALKSMLTQKAKRKSGALEIAKRATTGWRAR